MMYTKDQEDWINTRSRHLQQTFGLSTYYSRVVAEKQMRIQDAEQVERIKEREHD